MIIGADGADTVHIFEFGKAALFFFRLSTITKLETICTYASFYCFLYINRSQNKCIELLSFVVDVTFWIRW